MRRNAADDRFSYPQISRLSEERNRYPYRRHDTDYRVHPRLDLMTVPPFHE